MTIQKNDNLTVKAFLIVIFPVLQKKGAPNRLTTIYPGNYEHFWHKLNKTVNK